MRTGDVLRGEFTLQRGRRQPWTSTWYTQLMGDAGRFPGLEAIRAIAALVVVYGHVFLYGLVPSRGLLILPGQYATEAVMMFFVLSGAVISLSAERHKHRLANGKIGDVGRYLRARFVRIWPTMFVGLLLAILAERLIKSTWMSAWQIVGNMTFLQSLSGHIVLVPEFNRPLWSLSYEMTYYLLFAVFLLWEPFLLLWALAALAAVYFIYHPVLDYAPAAHFIEVLGFSVPWIAGHFVVRYRRSLPKLPVSFGVACLVIGLAFARCPLSSGYYDPFRLIMFALCCCPLILAIVQGDERLPASPTALRAARVLLAAVCLALLWGVSSSLDVVKVGLTIAVVGIVLCPPALIDKGLAALSWLLPSLVFIGSISYAIYATHTPILMMINHFGVHWPSAVKVAVFALIVTGLSIFLERVMQPAIGRRTAVPLGSSVAVLR